MNLINIGVLLKYKKILEELLLRTSPTNTTIQELGLIHYNMFIKSIQTFSSHGSYVSSQLIDSSQIK